jgi:hypothetical protein
MFCDIIFCKRDALQAVRKKTKRVQASNSSATNPCCVSSYCVTSDSLSSKVKGHSSQLSSYIRRAGRLVIWRRSCKYTLAPHPRKDAASQFFKACQRRRFQTCNWESTSSPFISISYASTQAATIVFQQCSARVSHITNQK